MVVDHQRTQHLISSSQFDVFFGLPTASTVLDVSVINNNANGGPIYTTLKYMNGTTLVLKTESGFSSGESVVGLTNSFSSEKEYKFPRNVPIPSLLLTSINESGTDQLIDYVVTYEYHPPGESAPTARLE